MHIEIAVDAMELAEKVDQIVLFSGDGDFRPLVEAIQRRGGLQSGRKRFQLRRVFSLAIIPKVRNQTQKCH
jgi:hypothetical protein